MACGRARATAAASSPGESPSEEGVSLTTATFPALPTGTSTEPSDAPGPALEGSGRVLVPADVRSALTRVVLPLPAAEARAGALEEARPGAVERRSFRSP